MEARGRPPSETAFHVAREASTLQIPEPCARNIEGDETIKRRELASIFERSNACRPCTIQQATAIIPLQMNAAHAAKSPIITRNPD
jgi:hypothetical protein